jgi:predicted  nucleic acid-binding Zn-ribbon protein
MSQNNEATQNPQENSGKIEKRFTANMAKLAAVFNNSERKVLGKKSKVANTDISTVIDELLKERKADVTAKFKQQCGELLDKKIAFDNEIKAEEEKLKKIKEQKMEEFSKAIEATFGLVESIDKLAGEYVKALGGQIGDEPAIAAAANA